jgi:type IV pilus assembly protein PilM
VPDASQESLTKLTPWSAVPATTYIGIPIDQLSGFPSLRAGDRSASAAFLEQPGRFAVACGLALQGLQRAAINTSLLRKEKTGLRDRLSGLIRKKQPIRTAWGLDVGTTSIKAVKLSCDGEGGNVQVDRCELIPLILDATVGTADEQRRVAIRAALDTLRSRQDLTADRLAVSLPGIKILGRQFALPPMDTSKIDAAVRFQVQHQVPFPAEELVWDYHTFLPGVERDARAPDDGRATDDQLRVYLMAAKHRQVDNALHLLGDLGVKLDILQAPATALHNLAVHELLHDCQTVGVIDIGHEATNLVISSPDNIWFRSFGPAGGEFTRALIQELKLTRSAAEQVKQDFASASRLHQVDHAIQPVLAALAEEIRRSVTSLKQMHPHLTVCRLYGVGGGFRMHGLLRYLLHGR